MITIEFGIIFLYNRERKRDNMQVKIGISNRHVHLSREDLDILFGSEYELTKKRDLLQPGQYACDECVTIKTDKTQINRVRIIGPVRSYTQIEISKSDAVKLGLNPPVRDSGDLIGSAAIEIIGPKGSVYKEEGCIIANRHIHMTSEDKTRFGLDGVDEVSVLLEGQKGGVLHHVSLKVADASALELHIDTDDANGHLVMPGDSATIIVEK